MISVIVPVLDDEDILPSCLTALGKCASRLTQGVQIIVVDNGSKRNWIPDFQERFVWATFLTHSEGGSYAARNAGVAAASGDIIAFTDADCRPHADWLVNAARHLREDPELDYIAGKIEISPNRPDAPTFADKFEMVTAFRQESYLHTAHFGATANVIVRKERIERSVGWFTVCGAGLRDDTAWGRAVFEAGLKQCYADDVVVSHPARRFGEILNKRRREYGHRFLRKAGGATRWELARLAMNDIRTDFQAYRSLIKYWGRLCEATPYNVIPVCLVGILAHTAGIVEKLRISAGGRPLPR